MNQQPQRPEDSLEGFCRELVQAARASQAEIDAAANAPFLYQRLRARIAAEQRNAPARRGWLAVLLAVPAWQRWALATLAAVALLVFAVPRGERAPSFETSGPSGRGKSDSTLAAGSASSLPASQAASKERKLERATPTRRARRAQRPVETPEQVTEFVPLTYVAQADESGHIVRVNLPRESLFALGVPVSAEQSGEVVKADVMVGDDGLARAIRFVR
jgi:hypothetical protein